MSGKNATPALNRPGGIEEYPFTLPAITSADSEDRVIFTATRECYIDDIIFQYEEGTTPAGTFSFVKISFSGAIGSGSIVLDQAINVATPNPATLVELKPISVSATIPKRSDGEGIALDILKRAKADRKLEAGDRLVIRTNGLDDIARLSGSVVINSVPAHEAG
jgi:hypothetical protein